MFFFIFSYILNYSFCSFYFVIPKKFKNIRKWVIKEKWVIKRRFYSRIFPLSLEIPFFAWNVSFARCRVAEKCCAAPPTYARAGDPMSARVAALPTRHPRSISALARKTVHFWISLFFLEDNWLFERKYKENEKVKNGSEVFRSYKAILQCATRSWEASAKSKLFLWIENILLTQIKD